MSNRIRGRLVASVTAGVLVAACGGSDATTEPTTTTRITLVPETTQPAFEPTEPVTVPDSVGVVEVTTPTQSTTSTTMPADPVSDSTVTDGAVETTVASDSPSLSGLELSSSGLGGAQFGAEPDGVVTYMSSFLGEPTSDTGYVDPFTIGACSGTELRLVSWGSLTLTFGDVSRVVQGQRHFYAYSYGIDGQPNTSPIGLATESGITVGSPLPDVLLAFPNLVINPADEFTPPNFFVNDDFRGYLTGLADDSTVSVIFGGLGCGE